MVCIVKPIVSGKETILQQLAVAEGVIEVYEGETYLHTQEGTHLWDDEHMLVMDDKEWHFAKRVWFIKYARLIKLLAILPLLVYVAVNIGVVTFMAAGPMRFIVLKRAVLVTVIVYLVMFLIAIAIRKRTDEKIRRAYI